MVKIYKQPFAHGGDTIAIPYASQPDGKMSSADGWTPDYQLPKTDPNYKPVGRQEMNGVFKDVTEALGQVQVQGAASWSSDGAPYPINAQVYHSGKQWVALRANSVEPVDGADWAAIGAAATRDVGESAGNVMKVGAFGLGAATLHLMPNRNGFFAESTSGGVNGTPSGGAGLISAYAHNRRGMIYIGTNGTAYCRFSFSDDTIDNTTPWNTLIASNNILQTTGNSTAFPMSQKAVTDAINNSAIGIGQTWQDVTASRSAGTTYTNTTGKPIQVAVGFNFSANTVRSYYISINGITATINSDGPTDVVIPNGSTYRVVVGGTASIAMWWELR